MTICCDFDGYYSHEKCGFHWWGKDDRDIPMKDGEPVCPRCEMERLMGIGRPIRNTHHTTRHPWPRDVVVQGGDRGVVFGGSEPYRTAFFEAFPEGSFLRGEGKTIVEAENACWEQFQTYEHCSDGSGEHGPYERRQYRNGSGFCTKCGTWLNRIFHPLSPEETPPDRKRSLIESCFGDEDQEAVSEVLGTLANVDELPEKHEAQGPDGQHVAEYERAIDELNWLNTKLQRDVARANKQRDVLGDSLERRLKEVYRERAHFIAELAARYPSGIGYSDPDAPEWAVVIIDTPAGQMSWHIAPNDVDLFRFLPPHGDGQKWDGHSNEEKYRRLNELTALRWEASQCRDENDCNSE